MNKKIKSVLVNSLAVVAVISGGIFVGQQAPKVVAFYNSFGQGEINQAITDKYNGKVVLYGKDTCPFCLEGKEILTASGVDWIYRNIEEDESAFKELQSLGENGVPVLIINDERISGFKKEVWQNSLGQ